MQQRHTYSSPLRYPGGKGSLANFMKLLICNNDLLDGHYVELYAGGAAVALELLFQEYVRKIHINDINAPLVAFWRSVLEQPEQLCRQINDIPVNMDQWYRQKNVLQHQEEHSVVEVGFALFFLNRTNRSGILNGGVIGGKNQTGTWKIDARYTKSDLINRIQHIARFANRINLYNQDAADFLQQTLPALPQKTLVYLDPPYFVKGQRLYENHYKLEDHKRIAQLVSKLSQPWLVSYDDCLPIEDLYQPFRNIRYSINYSARERYAGDEIIFFSDSLSIPPVTSPIAVKSVSKMQPLL